MADSIVLASSQPQNPIQQAGAVFNSITSAAGSLASSAGSFASSVGQQVYTEGQNVVNAFSPVTSAAGSLGSFITGQPVTNTGSSLYNGGAGGQAPSQPYNNPNAAVLPGSQSSVAPSYTPSSGGSPVNIGGQNMYFSLTGEKLGNTGNNVNTVPGSVRVAQSYTPGTPWSLGGFASEMFQKVVSPFDTTPSPRLGYTTTNVSRQVLDESGNPRTVTDSSVVYEQSVFDVMQNAIKPSTKAALSFITEGKSDRYANTQAQVYTGKYAAIGSTAENIDRTIIGGASWLADNPLTAVRGGAAIYITGAAAGFAESGLSAGVTRVAASEIPYAARVAQTLTSPLATDIYAAGKLSLIPITGVLAAESIASQPTPEARGAAIVQMGLGTYAFMKGYNTALSLSPLQPTTPGPLSKAYESSLGYGKEVATQGYTAIGSGARSAYATFENIATLGQGPARESDFGSILAGAAMRTSRFEPVSQISAYATSAMMERPVETSTYEWGKPMDYSFNKYFPKTPTVKTPTIEIPDQPLVPKQPTGLGMDTSFIQELKQPRIPDLKTPRITELITPTIPVLIQPPWVVNPPITKPPKTPTEQPPKTPPQEPPGLIITPPTKQPPFNPPREPPMRPPKEPPGIFTPPTFTPPTRRPPQEPPRRPPQEPPNRPPGIFIPPRNPTRNPPENPPTDRQTPPWIPPTWTPEEPSRRSSGIPSGSPFVSFGGGGGIGTERKERKFREEFNIGLDISTFGRGSRPSIGSKGSLMASIYTVTSKGKNK